MQQHCTVRAQIDLRLTPEQIEKAAENATKTMQELDKIEEKYSIYKRNMNSQIKDMKIEIRDLCQQFANKTRREEVECEQFFDIEKKRTWYEFEGEKYNERDISEDELAKVKQGRIFGDAPEVDGALDEAFEEEEYDDEEEDEEYDEDDEELEEEQAVRLVK